MVPFFDHREVTSKVLKYALTCIKHSFLLPSPDWSTCCCLLQLKVLQHTHTKLAYQHKYIRIYLIKKPKEFSLFESEAFQKRMTTYLGTIVAVMTNYNDYKDKLMKDILTINQKKRISLSVNIHQASFPFLSMII